MYDHPVPDDVNGVTSLPLYELYIPMTTPAWRMIEQFTRARDAIIEKLGF